MVQMMNGMNKVLRDFIPHITTPFMGCKEEEKNEELDDVPIKGFKVEEKNEE